MPLWIGEVAEYSRYFRTYAVDIPGEPGRSASNRPSWNGPEYAEWLADVLDCLHLPAASLLGLSQGGWTALKFATMYPARVEKLVLITPAGVVPDRPAFLLRAIVFSTLGRYGADRLNRYTFGDDPLPREAVSYMDAIMTHFKPRVGKLAMFTDDDLKRLAMPVLLLGGAKDAIRDVARASQRLARFCPGLVTRIFPDRGHVLINTAETVVSFLLS
jgi:pimeloyl-ACP methyl ester carboxylesterase